MLGRLRVVVIAAGIAQALLGCGRLDFEFARAPTGDATEADAARSDAVELDAAFSDAGADGALPDAALGAHRTYLKASNPGGGDLFGYAVAVSGDGTTLAVTARFEQSNATGVGGDQGNHDANEAGAAYVFVRAGAAWQQQAYIKAGNTDAFDDFGTSVALAADGNTLVVGASGESGNGAYSLDNSVSAAGAAYVYERVGATWAQTAYLKASNPDINDNFGTAVAISGDGDTIAVGATNESSAAPGIGGNQADNSLFDAGAVYVFARANSAWPQQAYAKATNPSQQEYFGQALGLSHDGSVLAVGGYRDPSDATGIDGNAADASAGQAGAVYVLARTGTAWAHQTYIKAATVSQRAFGWSLALDDTGAALVAGAPFDASVASGVGADPNATTGTNRGALYAFGHAAAWAQQSYVKLPTTADQDQLGWSVALSSGGARLAAGAYNTSGGGAICVVDAPATEAVFTAPHGDPGDRFGFALAMSASGATVLVGAPQEASAAMGVDGDDSDNSLPSAGAAFVIE